MLGDEIQGKIKGQSQGATVSHLNMEDIRALVLPELPLPLTQRRIADILSAYDDLIEVNTRRIRILEDMAQSIYREWFGKVDEQSLPDGWTIKTLDKISRNFDSKRVPLSSMKRAEMQGDYPYYGAAKVLDYVNDYIFDGK